MMREEVEPGDMVYAAREIRNDGSVPDLEGDAVIAPAGGRGVVLRVGHLEEEPGTAVFLVRFEDAQLELGPPVGCWEDDLRWE
jgi:nitrogen fixation protein NifZ